MKKLIIPDMGNSDPAEIIEILIAVGDQVEQEQSTIVLESEKATIEVPATASGKVEKLLVKVGDKIGSDQAYAEVSESDSAPKEETEQVEETAALTEETTEMPTADAEEEPENSSSSNEPEPNKTITSPTPTSEDPRKEDQQTAKVYAGPAVRKLARELGVELSEVTGTGLRHRIQKEDVHNHVKRTLQSQGRTGTWQQPVQPEIDFSQFGEVTKQPLNNIKRATAKAMSMANALVPQVTQFDQADITDLEAFRKEQNNQHKDSGVKFTLVPFVMKALARCVKDFPSFNASLSADGEHIIFKHYVNIGVAVDTPKGLLVPVIREVDQKSITDIASELQKVAERTRAGKLALDEMQGGNISISSLGGIGGTAFTPIVNPPEVAIVGLSKASIQPVWDGQEFQPRLMLPLSISYDHRVIDGAEAARFSQALCSYLTDLRQLLM